MSNCDLLYFYLVDRDIYSTGYPNILDFIMKNYDITTELSEKFIKVNNIVIYSDSF